MAPWYTCTYTCTYSYGLARTHELCNRCVRNGTSEVHVYHGTFSCIATWYEYHGTYTCTYVFSTTVCTYVHVYVLQYPGTELRSRPIRHRVRLFAFMHVQLLWIASFLKLVVRTRSTRVLP